MIIIKENSSASHKQTLAEMLIENGVHLELSCGGTGKCGKCLAKVWGNLRNAAGEIKRCSGEDILTCRWSPCGEVWVELPEGHENAQVRTDAIKIVGGQRDKGLAVDVGTTTIAAFLYDLETGECLKQYGELNAQRRFGSDVISRIQYCSKENGLGTLTACLRTQIMDMIQHLGVDKSELRYISIAGNTVMEHILAGLSPQSIGVSPFTPLSLFGEERKAKHCFHGFSEDCGLYLAPAIAGYVGGDISAGLVSSGAYKKESTVIFLDIGTNGEIAIGSKEGFVCCAAAAGPAFEGAEIACGSPACDGAIYAVNQDLSFSVLGGVPPKSICGSGVIDAVAALLHHEIIEESGYLQGGTYLFTEDVYISAEDVRKIQLAKAAIRAGIETLLSAAGKEYEDITEVLIAGGFGAHLRIESACAIGLLPPAFQNKAKHIGNSAGQGAALALTCEGRKKLEETAQKCRYLELATSKVFQEKYIEAIMFDEG